MEEERDNRRRYNNSQRQNNRDYQRDNNKDIPQNQEEKVPENTDKDTLVNLNVNTEKSEKKINLSNLKIDQLHLALYEVNGMIVDFYDKTLAELGSQGVLDDSGRPMDPANFSTPEEKFKALTSVLSIQHSFGNNLDKVMNIAKSKKEQLKERAIKILDGEQELIDENNKLIESAKYKIGELKNEKTALDNKRTEEMRNLEAEERKKISLKNLCDEITEKIEVLKEQINNPPADLIQANSQNQKGRGNQNALSEYIKGLNEQIKFQQGEFANYSNDLSNCEKNAQKMMANADNLEKQSISMQEKIDVHSTSLDALIAKSGELTKAHYANIDKLEGYFKDNIKGLTVDDTKLNYEKETKVKSTGEEKANEVNENADVPENNEQVAEQSGDATSGGAGGNIGYTVPDDIAKASERALASYGIENLMHASPAQIRNTLKGNGYSDLVDILDSASAGDKRHLRNILANSQDDLGVIDKADFVSKLTNIVPSEFDLEKLYDTIFDKDGNYVDFSKHNDEQINLLRSVMDYYNKAMYEQKLTFDQMKIFDENFAQYAKIGALMEKGSLSGGFKGFFRNIFKGKTQAAKNHFLYSLVDYSDSYSGYLSRQYNYQSGIRAKLGEQVNPVESYAQRRPNFDSRSRLKRKVENGEIGRGM